MHRIHPSRRVGVHVFLTDPAAGLPRERVNRFGILAAVESFALRFGNAAEGLRHLRAVPDLAGLRRMAFRREHLLPGTELVTFQLRKNVIALLPELRDHRGDRVAFLRVFDRGLQELLKREPSEALRKRCPAGHRAGHHHRDPTARRHLLMAERLDRFSGDALRRIAACVQAVKPAVHPHLREAVRAKAVLRRLHDRHAGSRRDRGVHGVSALFQHVKSCLRCQRLRGRCHAARRIDQTSAGRIAVVVRVKFHLLPHFLKKSPQSRS